MHLKSYEIRLLSSSIHVQTEAEADRTIVPQLKAV